MTRLGAACGAFAAAAVGVIGVTGVFGASGAHAQVLPPPPVSVTTPPIDLSVPQLGIEVHVPGQDVGAASSGVPGVPSVPGVSGSGGAPGSAPGAPSAPASAPDAPATADASPAPAPAPAPDTGATPAAGPASAPGDDSRSSGPSRPGGSGGNSDVTLGSAVVGTITEPGTLVGALTLALGLGVVVGAAPYLPRYRRRQRDLLEEWARASEHEHAVATKLAAADEQKSEFLALVSHELRTPLTAVKGFVDTVLLHWDRLPDERRRDLLTRASSNADELGRLVRQLMEFGRTETGPIEITPAELHVNRAVDVALTGIAPVVADHHVEVDVPDGLAVDADADAFNHVLVNLLTNAVKFSPTGSRIRVRARHDGDVVVVSVADEGVGIERDEQERIFDRYYQSGNGDHARGTGIGLTIAQRFTAQHGGQIWVDSEPGVGSTFAFTMPAAATPTATSRTAAHAATAPAVSDDALAWD